MQSASLPSSKRSLFWTVAATPASAAAARSLSFAEKIASRLASSASATSASARLRLSIEDAAIVGAASFIS